MSRSKDQSPKMSYNVALTILSLRKNLKKFPQSANSWELQQVEVSKKFWFQEHPTLNSRNAFDFLLSFKIIFLFA